MGQTTYIFNHRCVNELEHVFYQILPVDCPEPEEVALGVSTLLSLAFESIKSNRMFPETPDGDLFDLYCVWEDVKILMDRVLIDLRNQLVNLPGALTSVTSIRVSGGAIYLYIGGNQCQQPPNFSSQAPRLISIPTRL